MSLMSTSKMEIICNYLTTYQSDLEFTPSLKDQRYFLTFYFNTDAYKSCYTLSGCTACIKC